MNDKLLDFAMRIQSIAQAGLQYGKDKYDRERYEELRQIAAEMISEKTYIPMDRVYDLFCNETGYQTPKIDTRAAVFVDGRILLVHENNGTWSLPGGWCDVNVSVGENTVKEVREEAGLTVIPVRVIAVQDRERHNLPRYAYGVCKIFVQCAVIGGSFAENSETIQSRYFAEDELPPLAEEKNNAGQIRMCFAAARAAQWQTLLE